MRKLFVNILTLLSVGTAMAQMEVIPSGSVGETTVQTIRVEVNSLERQDSCMKVDMNIDLSEVHLIPDCTIYLHPWLRSEKDSLLLPPVVLNGPQSDLMYRRRQSLGKTDSIPPHIAIREGGHQLPCVNYRKMDIPYQQWMDSATIVLRDENCNCDNRLIPFSMKVERILPLVIIQKDTVIIHDTIKIDRPVVKRVPLVAEKKKETVIEHAGYRANIYFPVNGMKILPEHDLNRVAWHKFVSEIDSLRTNNANTVLGITVIGYSSPEGSYNANDIVAKRRALALKKYLETVYDPTQVEIRTEWIAEDWDGLEELIRASDMIDKDKVLNIIDNVDIFKGRESQLKYLSSGAPWRYMMNAYFPRLRCASCRIGYLKRIEK